MYVTKTIILVLFACIQTIFCQNLKELQKLQEEYKKALERQSLQKPQDISNAEKTIKNIAIPEKLVYSRKDIESLLVNTEKMLKQLQFLEDSTSKMPFIGYEFFTKRDSIPFWQNLPINKNYILGAGDEIIIALWGESSSYDTKIINRDGQIFIENIGILDLGGKSVSNAKNYIKSKYSRVYSTLLGENPKSFIDLSLGELKSINVHFVGFVNIPGVHMVHPFSSVINGLIQAGGINIDGSLRDISISRDGEEIGNIDLYSYIINGNSLDDLRLMDQDIIHVPPRKSTIPLSGRVLRPGYYEMTANETISDLIAFSGGVDRFASKNIFVYKNTISDKNGYIFEKNENPKFKIFQGDSVHIPIDKKPENFIVIQGQVKNPGKYPYNQKLKLRNIIEATSSLDDEDFSLTMNLSNISIFRKNPSNNKPIKILTKLNDNPILKNGDYITISPSNYLNPIESIAITGEIKSPGVYPVNNITTLKDILNLTGGYTEFAMEEGIEVFRDSLKIAWETYNFALIDGDSLNVLKKSGLIRVKGEVNIPGFISFNKNYSLKDYIKKAGGLTAFAEKNTIYITYPNGSSFPFSGWKKPKVKEGSIITVEQRTIGGKNNVSGLEVFSSISSQAASIATTLLSISLLMNQSSN